MKGLKRILSFACLLALLFPTLCLAEYPAERGPTDYAGVWHADNVLGGAYSARFRFRADGSFAYLTAGYPTADRESGFGGTYVIADGKLTLTIQNKILYEGGTLAPANGYWPEPFLEGGEKRLVPLAPEAYETRVLDISDVTPCQEPEHPSYTLTIDGVRYWDYSGYDDLACDAIMEPYDAFFDTREELPEQENIAASGANDFAFRLSAKLLQQAGDGNFICSPYSVWLPLAALVNAAKEPYKTELLEALSASDIGEAELNQAASRMLYDLTNQESERIAAQYGEEYRYDPLKIANAVFVDHSVTLKRDFAQAFVDSYRGVSRELDFGSPQAAQEVNRWASESTEGMIPEIVQGFSPGTLAVIANAIYFADRWSWEFSPEQTEQGPFHSPTGETDASFMLREGRQLPYYEDDTLQAMPLAFETGGGMLILLPKDGDATALLAYMTNERFQDAVRLSDERPGKLLLPRFSIESDVMEISDPLASLGIPLFNQGDAPLTGIVEGDDPVWISDVLHKAAIEVDERGTTAAAVTVLALGFGATPPDPEPVEPFEMICDRPFAFILYGHTSDGGNQVLFTGVVNRP